MLISSGVQWVVITINFILTAGVLGGKYETWTGLGVVIGNDFWVVWGGNVNGSWGFG